MKTSKFLALLAWLMLALFSVDVAAQQAAEPTVHQIYERAAGGDMRGAREMIDQVLSKHPGSAKAHYVKAELAARDRDTATARSELQAAEQLSPGLPFARPEAVAALRSELDAPSAPSAAPRADTPRAGANRMGAPPQDTTTRSAGGGFPLGALLIGAIVIGGVFMLMRRRRAAQGPQAGPYGPGGMPMSPEARRGFDPAPMQGYGPAMGQQPGTYGPMGQPQQPGMGSSIMRGVGTGLAVGAGVVAAQEIGRRMFDHRDNDPSRNSALGGHDAADSQLARDAGLGGVGLGGVDPLLNRDMGGQDFGIADGGGWDDGGIDMGDAGGGDWDNS
jgi:hypothetical protein